MTAACGDVDLARDRDLVARYQAGDAAAFDELYLAYFPRLHRFCRRHVRDVHVAEELAQEAFLRALRALPDLQGERRFYPWMTVIARRLCIDHLRRDARSLPRPDIDAGVAEGADVDVLAQVERHQVGEALQRVRDRHREILHLREWEDMSYEAIAAHLDAPMTTVQSLLVRARTSFRREYLAVCDGTLAALPLFGVGAVWRERRLRVATWCREAIAPLQAVGAPGAAAVTAVVVLAGLPPTSHAAGEEAQPVPLVIAPAIADEPADEPALPPAEADPPPPTPATASPEPVAAPAPPPPPPQPTASAPAPVTEVRLGGEGAEESRRQAVQMPLAGEVGPGFVGSAPAQITEDAAEAALTLLGVDR